MRKLQFSLQALAQPTQMQVQLFPDIVCKVDELALEFDDALKCASTALTPEQIALFRPLDKKLADFSGEKNASHWTEEALRTDPIWVEVRTLAKEVLTAMGWPVEPPPRRPEDRGVVYVKGR